MPPWSYLVLAMALASSGALGTARAPVPAAHAEPAPAPQALPPRSLTVPIITYHQIRDLPFETDRTALECSVSPLEFACQLDWLRARGYTTITLDRLGAALDGRAELPPHPVVLTFDDGWASHALAADALHRRGMTGTFFICPDLVAPGEGTRYLSWAGVLRLEHLGMEIGSHTLTHANLPSLPPGDARRELAASRLELEGALGHPVRTLAYPFGEYSEATLALARDAGYALAVSTDHGVTHTPEGRLHLRRVNVGYLDELPDFARKVEGRAPKPRWSR